MINEAKIVVLFQKAIQKIQKLLTFLFFIFCAFHLAEFQ